MVIAVDFDGTIVEHKYPAIGKEIPFAFDTLKKLSESRHKLILWSVREGKLLDEAVQFCKDNGVEFYAVNSELPGSGMGAAEPRKVRADMYIDDRNLGGVPDWPLVYRMITEHLTYADLISGQVEDMEIHSSTYEKSDSAKHSHHHHSHSHGRHHGHRRGFFRWIAERCYAARNRYEH